MFPNCPFGRSIISTRALVQSLRRLRFLHVQRRRVKCANGKFVGRSARKVKIDIV